MPVHCWKNMVTVAAMTRLNMGLVLKSETIATNCLENFVRSEIHMLQKLIHSLTVFQAVSSCKWGKRSATIRFSNIDWALISANSMSISSWFWGNPRKLDRTRRPSGSLLWWTSHLGLNGINIMPTPKMTAGQSCMQSGRNEAASFWVSPVLPMKFYQYD